MQHRLIKRFIYRLVLGAAVTLVAGCGGGGGDDNDGSPIVIGTEPENTATAVEFTAQVNGEAFVCGQTYSGVGISLPDTYKVIDMRFYVYDVELVKADGEREMLDLEQDGVWQYENVALIDLEDGCNNGTPETNAWIIGEIPNADYAGICFKLGLPYELNHFSDATAPSPINSSGMLWNWRFGRKFIRIDGIGDPDNIDQPFHIHLGSTECPGDAVSAPPTGECGFPNIVDVCLDDFDVDQDQIVIDVGPVLAASSVTVNTPDTQPGCMSANSDPECIEVMPRLGLDFTFVAGAGAPPEQYPASEPQQLFKVLKP